jgi:hypothetical protein
VQQAHRGYKSAVYRNGKAPRKLIQSEKFGGVVAPIQKTRRLQMGADCAFCTRQNAFAILPYRLERYGKQETRFNRLITVLVLAMQAEKTLKNSLSD